MNNIYTYEHDIYTLEQFTHQKYKKHFIFTAI